MENASAFERARQLDIHVTGILSYVDSDTLMPDERKLFALIKRQLNDARLDTRDYEYAQTRAEQLEYAATAKKTFATVQEHILQASEHNIFGAADVAHISAQIQQIIAQLQ